MGSLCKQRGRDGACSDMSDPVMLRRLVSFRHPWWKQKIRRRGYFCFSRTWSNAVRPFKPFALLSIDTSVWIEWWMRNFWLSWLGSRQCSMIWRIKNTYMDAEWKGRIWQEIGILPRPNQCLAASSSILKFIVHDENIRARPHPNWKGCRARPHPITGEHWHRNVHYCLNDSEKFITDATEGYGTRKAIMASRHGNVWIDL